MEHRDQQKGEVHRPPSGGFGRGLDDLTLDTSGQLRPQYELVPRPAGHVAVGELAIEHMLGPVRVANVVRLGERQPGESFVQVTWSDDHGPSTATGQYPADRILPVRLPGPADRLSIRQAIERAERLNRDITEDSARLVAAHLHTGPRSAVYDFAIDGAVRDRVYDELDEIQHQRPYARTWVQALARYCLGREDLGPMPGWRATRGAAWSRRKDRDARQDQEPATDVESDSNNGPLDQEFMRSELAAQLIDAAFIIGTAARSMDVFASGSLVKVLHRMKNAA